MGEGTDTESTVLEQREDMFEGGELQRELIRRLSSSEAIETVAAFVASPGIQRMVSLAAKFSTGVATFLHTPEVQSRLKAVHDALTSPEMIEVVRALSELNRQSLQLADSPLADYLASSDSHRQSQVIQVEGVASLSFAATGYLRVARPKDLELERQIVNHLQKDADVAEWTPAQLFYLKNFIRFLRLVLCILAAQSLVRTELCHYQPKLLPLATYSQVGKSVRSFLCEAELPVEMLRDYRTVKGVGVRLRAAPGMKADIVPFNLEDRALLEVLDSTNRDWLHVSVVNEEGLTGWISRRYTYPLLR